ncbi:MAG: hypothetical protein EA407_08370 [Rhodobacteraceae bacterium]|nr:MAG: hypothetical protein EA407_08370 [Paracoccaceae bacterium]
MSYAGEGQIMARKARDSRFLASLGFLGFRGFLGFLGFRGFLGSDAPALACMAIWAGLATRR